LQKVSALTSLENIALPAPTAQAGGSRVKCPPHFSQIKNGSSPQKRLIKAIKINLRKQLNLVTKYEI
jgi:hypothetical protein